jgi:predicted transcriptional regulator
MARPPKEKKEKRSFRYTFRMTEEEMEFLERLSEYADLPPAEVIRASVFKNRLPQAKMPLLDRQAYLELKRIGNNINQIARHYNSRITVPEHRLKALIDDR